MKDVIEQKKFSEIDLSDSFFDTLKEDYPEFENWFCRKQDKSAFVQYDDNGRIMAFLYLKDESNITINDVEPNMPACRRLKVGTFKIVGHNTKLGENFIKLILKNAILQDYEEVYLTIFEKHKPLLALLTKYGFSEVGTKQGELVLAKQLKGELSPTELLKNYPRINLNGRRKFVLSIYPKFHTELFPDSILYNEVSNKSSLVRDVSHTNSIHKIYISFIEDTSTLSAGDIVVIYRTSDGLGPAYYRSVVTSICQIEEVRTKMDFSSCQDFISYTNRYSIFEDSDLRKWYKRNQFIVLKMTYNISFEKKVTRKVLLEELQIPSDIYWGFFELSDEQFKQILRKGGGYEGFIVD